MTNLEDLEKKINSELTTKIKKTEIKHKQIYLDTDKDDFIDVALFLKINDKINLELPLKYGTKISGHICQGHVDTVGKVLSIKKIDKSFLFDFDLPKKERKHLIEKASICVNGISLTISKVTKKGFQIWIIPHTYKETNLSTLKKSSLVNIEIDILSKYVRNYFNGKK